MITVFEYAFAGAMSLLGLIGVLFLKLYPKVRDFIDKEESEARSDYAKLFAMKIFDLSKEHQAVYDQERRQWVSSIPAVKDLEKFTMDMMKSSDKLWDRVRKARKLRDNLDNIVVSLIVGVITFFVTPLMPTLILAEVTLAIGISATVIGLLILFYLVKKLY